VALSGTPAPGTATGAAFEVLSAPQIDASGRTMFSGNVAGAGINSENNTGLWIERGGTLSLVLHEGEAAPGFPNGATFVSLFATQIADMNRRGDIVVFASAVDADQRRRLGIWTTAGGSLSLVARTGVTMPQTGTTIFDFLPSFGLSDEGQIAFGAFNPRIEPGNRSDEAVWFYDAGSLELVARTGHAAPHVADNAVYALLGYPAVNGRGNLLFLGHTPSPTTSAIFERRDGIMRTVALTGMQAPGTVAGTFYSSFLSGSGLFTLEVDPAYNDAGQVAFAAAIQGGDATADKDTGLWAGAPGSLELVAREGDQAPALAAGIVFADLQGRVNGMGSATRAVLDPQGHVAFNAYLRGTGVEFPYNTSIWSNRGGALALIARGGEAPPGAAADRLYGTMADPHVNASGRIAFSAQLRDSMTKALVGSGIWAEDVNGVLRSIVQTGDVLDIGGGSFRTVERAVFAGRVQAQTRYYPRGSGFNDRGQVAFSALFTDGSYGVFVSDLVAVPEPGAVLVLMGLLPLIVLKSWKPSRQKH